MAEMGRVRKPRSVRRDSEVVAFYELAYRLPHPVPTSVTAERNSDLLREQVLEVVLGVAMKTLSNYANQIIHAPLDSQFQAEAWDVPARCNKQCA